MIQIIEDESLRQDWNSVACHPMQSWEWGEAREKMGISVIRIGKYKNKKLSEVFLLTKHQLPGLPFFIGYIPRSSVPSDDVISFLKEAGKKENMIYIKLEPNEGKNSKFEIRSSKLVKSRAPLFPEWTQVIDLTPSEDDLLKKMKPKTRYNIRLAQKKGVTVKEMTNEKGFEIFIKLYFDTTKRQHYAGHNSHYHKVLFESLQNSISHILIAFYQDEPLAAYHLFTFNDKLYYPYGGSSDKFREVMAANLLMWEAMRFGKSKNAVSFDLWGSLAPHYDTKNIWSGFTRFKEGFGTEFVQMVGSYDLVLNPLLYWPLILAQKIREKMLGA